MSSSHIPAAELELFVIDALPPRRAMDVEQHLLECVACSEALAREAALEMTLFSVAKQVEEVRTLRKVGPLRRTLQASRGLAITAAAAVSLAAAWTLFIGQPPVTPGVASAGWEAEADAISRLHDAAAGFDGRTQDPLDGGSRERLAGL